MSDENIIGTECDDKLVVKDVTGSVSVNALGGNDKVIVKDIVGNVDVDAGAGDDKVYVKDVDGDVAVAAGDGDDRVSIKEINGSVALNAGDGDDKVYIKDVTGNVDVAAGDGDDRVSIKDINGSVEVSAGEGDDRVHVRDVNDQVSIAAGVGDDRVHVRDVNGDVAISAGDGDDRVSIRDISGHINLTTGEGDDRLTIKDVNGDVDVDTSDGDDRIHIRDVNGEVSVLAGLGDDHIGLKNINGDVGLAAGSGDDHIHIRSIDANVGVNAGDGDDRVHIKYVDGDVTVSAEEGNDKIIIKHVAGDVTVLGGEGNDWIIARDIYSSNDTLLFGEGGNDYIRGGNQNDHIQGGSGSDHIRAKGGDDTVIYDVDANAGAWDFAHGGYGYDLLKITVTQQFLNDNSLLPGQIEQFFADHGGLNGQFVNFSSLGFDLSVKRFEAIQVNVVGGGNNPPLAVDDDLTGTPVLEDGTLTNLNILGNDSDVDGTLDITSVNIISSTNGVAMANLDGTVNFTHDGSETTAASFTYTVNDNLGAPSNVATVTLVVTPVNDAPTIMGTPDTMVDEGDAYSFIPTASDPENDTLIFSIQNKPSWADFDASTGELSGAPLDMDVGEYSNIIISVFDGEFLVNLAPFSIDVNNINNPPTISGTPDTEIDEDGTYSFTPMASDPDGDVLQFSIQNRPLWADFDTATGELSGMPLDADVGVYANIIISVFDGEFLVSLDPFSIEVNNVNDAPLAVNDDLTGTPVLEGGTLTNLNILGNDSDVDGTLDVASVNILSSTNGMATANLDGTVDFTHDGSETTTASFTYLVNDNLGAPSNIATVTLAVTPVNDPSVVDLNGPIQPGNDFNVDYIAPANVEPEPDPDPTPNPNPNPNPGTGPVNVTDSDATIKDVDSNKLQSLTVTILAFVLGDNDVLAADTGTTAIMQSYIDGVLALTGDGTIAEYEAVLRTVTYDNSDPGNLLSRTLEFTAVDEEGASSNIATTVITISQVNTAPVAVDDVAATDNATAVIIDVLVNDSDADSDALMIDNIDTATLNTVGMVGHDGSEVIYTPQAGFVGTDSFQYTVSDGNDGTAVATVNVTVTDVIPVVLNQASSYQEEIQGEGQAVAVISSGIAYDHFALGGGFGAGFTVVDGFDFAENDANPYDDGPSGSSGTHLAGILGSTDSRVDGIWGEDTGGAVPDADLVALRVFDDQGTGFLTWFEAALQWIIDNNDSLANPISTVVIDATTPGNNSELPPFSSLEEELALLANEGIFVTAPAGNLFTSFNAPGLSYPAVSPFVVGAMSHDDNGSLSFFSQREDSALAAPGRAIISTVPDHAGNNDGFANDFASFSGTQQASAQLAGAAVIVREALEKIGATNIDQDMINTLLRDNADTLFDMTTMADYLRVNLDATLDAIFVDVHADTIATADDLGSLTSASNIQVDAIISLTDWDAFSFTAAETGTVTISFNSQFLLNPVWEFNNVLTASNSLQIDIVANQSYSFRITDNGDIGAYDLDLMLVADVVDITPPAAPINLQATLSMNGDEIALTWNPSSEPDLIGYNVYRDGDFPITTVMNSFIDGNIIPGTTYSYVVTAIDTSGNESGPSMPQVIAVPAPDFITPEAGDADQLMVYLVNEARSDPLAAVARSADVVDLNQGIPIGPGTISSTAKQPLAMNESLMISSELHSLDMLLNDYFSHFNLLGQDQNQRAQAAGYPGTVGENLNFVGSTGPIDMASEVSRNFDNFFSSPAMRQQMLLDADKEIGAGVEFGVFTPSGTSFNTSMATVVAGSSAPEPLFLTGVVYDDVFSMDDKYGFGEGLGGTIITVEGVGNTIANSAGGWVIPLVGAGTYTVTASGPAVDNITYSTEVTVGTQNVAVDFARGPNVAQINFVDTAFTSIEGSSGNDVINGSLLNDTINAKAGADVISGDDGMDTFIYTFGDGGALLSEADVINDFTNGQDVFSLTNGLTVANLLFVDTDTDGNAELQVNDASQEFLVELIGVTVGELDASDFI